MKPSVLILGASGFIGGHLLRAAQADSHIKVQGFASSRLDLTNREQVMGVLPGLLDGSRLVMVATVRPDHQGSADPFQSNIEMCRNVAEAVKQSPPCHVVYVSSVDVYGRSGLSLPLTEDSPLHPDNLYGISKLTGEFLFQVASADSGTPLTVLRPPLIYGPGMAANSLLARWIRQASEDHPMDILGDGSNLLEFFYVEDFWPVISQILDHSVEGVFNLVSGQSYSVREFHDLLSRLLNRPVQIKISSEKYPEDLVFALSGLHQHFRFPSFTNLESGLVRTVNSVGSGGREAASAR